MTTFTEENVFPDTVQKVNLDIGNYEANKRINATIEALVNRTRFLKEHMNDGGSGFNYGGEWNAEPTITTQDVAAFDVLNNCTYTETTLSTASPSFSAFVNDISDVDSGTTRKFKFTWPDTASSAFLVGFVKTTLTDMQQITADEESSMVCIGSFFGSTVLLTKQVNQALVQTPYSGTTIEVGDEVSLSYRAATQTLYFYNESQGQTLIAQFNLQPYFSSRPMLLVGGVSLANLECNFEDAYGYPLQQDIIGFEFPDDLTKTYLITSVTQDSVINNKRLNTDDFVNFISNESDVIDVVISRLVTDAHIQSIVTTMLNEPNITPLEVINPVGDGVAIVTLENANEINIIINGEYDPAPQFNFNLNDSCFVQNRLVCVRLNALIAIPFFSIEYSTYYGQAVILENITAETSWVFVFEKRGNNVELISKYPV